MPASRLWPDCTAGSSRSPSRAWAGQGASAVWATSTPLPPGGLYGDHSPGGLAPDPGAGGAQRSFRGSPQMAEAEAEGCPGSALALLWGKRSSSCAQDWGWEQGGTQRDPSSCPPMSHERGRGAGTLRNSLELRKTGPSRGCAPRLSAAPGSSAGAGKGEEEAGRTRAWCRPLLSWRGSKSNILQGRYFPCSAHAQFKRPLCSSKRAFVSNAYCERKKNHSYPPSQGLRASELLPISEESSALLSGRAPAAAPCRATGGQAARTVHGALWAGSAQTSGLGAPGISPNGGR